MRVIEHVRGDPKIRKAIARAGICVHAAGSEAPSLIWHLGGRQNTKESHEAVLT